jgi:2-dehydro-3-deoxyphosphogluconate aldolase/(4S)-4-hydroxy-2-oxoglutarate aldolase
VDHVLVLDRLREGALVAVLRAPDRVRAQRAIEVLVSAGVPGIEVTYTTPDATQVVEWARTRYGDDLLLGAGTIRNVEQVADAIGAGAEFLVAPGTDPSVVEGMLDTGAAVVAGVLTPTEVIAAIRLGVHVCKVFPASLGGPAYLKALREPFPEVRFMPTGGVGPDSVADWLHAGAFALGSGSDLASYADLVADDLAAVQAKAERMVKALAAARVV